MNALLKTDKLRTRVNNELDENQRIELGQFMTSTNIASFMASLFPSIENNKIRLLDPGAGIGSLSISFINKFIKLKGNLKIDLTTYEIDPIMIKYLKKNLSEYQEEAILNNCSLSWSNIEEDFINNASAMLLSKESLWSEGVKTFTHCIINPPYKKISSSSRHRKLLRLLGIETVNMYSAFIALSILLLEDKGYLVAIIPRSFCNGPYYRPFREFILNNTAIKKIHLFKSRSKAFKDDNVLQENIILALQKNGIQSDVEVSISTDDSFNDINNSTYPFQNIVKKYDKERFIHIPTSKKDISNLPDVFNNSLSDIGVNISTGPVVDYRIKDNLIQMPREGTVPLLYPCHFKNNIFIWPIEDGKKPNAIINNSETKKWLYPNGFYTVVRRFSTKEEKRRIVANIVDPNKLGNSDKIGLENHLNVFHNNKKPLTENMARGLAVYLNSSLVDNYFRQFSGHTQVNATDLKLITYPSKHVLVKLGEWAISQINISQEIIDRKIGSIL